MLLIKSVYALALACVISHGCNGFVTRPIVSSPPRRSKQQRHNADALRHITVPRAASSADDGDVKEIDDLITDMSRASVWEKLASVFVKKDFAQNPSDLKQYVQLVTLFRVGIPALLAGLTASQLYTPIAYFLADLINDGGAFDVIANDYSQYIQNILTTCGLMFSILCGYTFYFLYQQQESVYYSLYEEVTVAMSLLEQVSLVCQGRDDMYNYILSCIDRYVREDLTQFGVEPAVLLSARPVDDPLEEVMYATSVGEPSVIYQTVKSLRQARAARLGALQRKLPPIQMILLYTLGTIVLSTFPVLGAGVQTLGGEGILKVQSVYISFTVAGIFIALGVINELRQPDGKGAYNALTVLSVMVEGLEEELENRKKGNLLTKALSPSSETTINPTLGFDMGESEIGVVDIPVESMEDASSFSASSSNSLLFDSIDDESTSIVSSDSVSLESSIEDTSSALSSSNSVSPSKSWIGRRLAQKFRRQ